jgi:hypothetical protein
VLIANAYVMDLLVVASQACRIFMFIGGFAFSFIFSRAVSRVCCPLMSSHYMHRLVIF